MTRLENPVIVGKVVGEFGRSGGLKVVSYTRPVLEIFNYDHWFVGEAGEFKRLTDNVCHGVKNFRDVGRRVEVVGGEQSGRSLVAKIEWHGADVDLSAMVGRTIAVDRNQLPELPQGEFYWSELIGLQVRNVDGSDLGVVEDILETGANDVLQIGYCNTDSATGEKPVSRLLPWTDSVVLDVNLEQKSILVDWPLEWE